MSIFWLKISLLGKELLWSKSAYRAEFLIQDTSKNNDENSGLKNDSSSITLSFF
jgi:hypothetical protein